MVDYSENLPPHKEALGVQSERNDTPAPDMPSPDMPSPPIDAPSPHMSSSPLDMHPPPVNVDLPPPQVKDFLHGIIGVQSSHWAMTTTWNSTPHQFDTIVPYVPLTPEPSAPNGEVSGI